MSTMEERFVEAISTAHREGGPDAFFGWFDADENLENSLKNGAYDFAVTVLRDPVPLHLTRLFDKTALEIGYGGGRLLHAAAHIFRDVIGVDIHPLPEVVDQMLRAQGVTNFALHKITGKDIPVPSGSIDFVYSHIVLLHLSGPEVFETYLSETFRVLKPGGIASLYYGRPFGSRTKMAPSRLAGSVYRALEPIAELALVDLPMQGYRCLPSGPANSISLMVSRRRVKQLALERGFEMLSLRTSPRWVQGHVVLRRPG